MYKANNVTDNYYLHNNNDKHIICQHITVRLRNAEGVPSENNIIEYMLKDLVALLTAESRRRLMKVLAYICSKLLRDQIPKHARDLLFK